MYLFPELVWYWKLSIKHSSGTSNPQMYAFFPVPNVLTFI